MSSLLESSKSTENFIMVQLLDDIFLDCHNCQLMEPTLTHCSPKPGVETAKSTERPLARTAANRYSEGNLDDRFQ